MTTITLDKAPAIIAAALAHDDDARPKPRTVAVVDASDNAEACAPTGITAAGLTAQF